MFASRLVSLLLVAFAAASCAPDNNAAFQFQEAVERMSQALMSQFQLRSLAPLAQATAALGSAAGMHTERDINSFVIDAFVDGDSGNVTGASSSVTRILSAEIAVAGAQYHVVPLNQTNLSASRYVVTGTTKYEPYPGTGNRRYHIYGSIVDLESGTIMAHAATWVSDPKIDDVPTPFYKNSPMYLKDASVDRQLDAAQASAGSDRGLGYVRTLNAAAVTSEGAAALDRSDFTRAAQLFNTSLQAPDGRTMKNYSGLYQSYVRLNQKSDAEQAFYKLFSLAVENNNVKIKFLYSVGTTEFIGDQGLRGQYDMWLREISQYLASNQVCMEISGHASHTGTAEYNRTLSLQRAQHIKSALTVQAPNLSARLTAVGRGFDQNIVGSGTDDDQDAVDRRVEFKPLPCGAA